MLATVRAQDPGLVARFPPHESGRGAPSSEGVGEAESHVCGRQETLRQAGRQAGVECLDVLPSCLCASFSGSSLGNQPPFWSHAGALSQGLCWSWLSSTMGQETGMGRTASYWLIYLAFVYFTTLLPRPATASCHGDGRCVRVSVLSAHSLVRILPASHWPRPGTCLSPPSASAPAAQRCVGTEGLLLSIMSFIPTWANALTVTSEPCIGNDSKLIFCSPEGVV